MFAGNNKSKFWISILLVSVIVLASSFTRGPATSAQEQEPYFTQVRAFEPALSGFQNPAGLAYSPAAQALLVFESRPASSSPLSSSEIKMVNLLEDPAGSSPIPVSIPNPLNMAFDNQSNSLYVLDQSAQSLVQVPLVSNDSLSHLERPSIRFDVRPLGLNNPQGITFDPGSGRLFVLDASGPRLVRVSPDVLKRTDGLVSAGPGEIREVGLNDLKAASLSGISFNPQDNHLYVLNATGKQLHELTETGQLVSTRDLSPLTLVHPQGMVFAPSGDQTDDPAIMNLFLADSGNLVVSEPYITSSSQVSQLESQAIKGISDIQTLGQIVELSLIPPAAPLAVSFISTLVNNTDMAVPPFAPPSPDPSGLTYISSTNTLLMSDSEVEETVGGITNFQGVNVWEYILDGSLVVDTANISNVSPTVVPISNEPTGIAWNPSNGHIFFSDDDADLVYDLDPSTDNQIGTADDTWTSFSVRGVGSGDPEGIAYDSTHDWLFVVDGMNAEIYKFSPDGILLGQFDTEKYGAVNPQSVEFNAASGTLFVLGNRGNKVIVETTLGGVLLRTIDFSPVNVKTANGLTFAPASDGSGANRFYILDRGIDNNYDPNIIDGKLFEATAPELITPGNLPPGVDAGLDQNFIWPINSVNLDGTVSDDKLPDPPAAVTTSWSKVSGPCTVTFGNMATVDTTANFLYPGRYILQLDASDSELNSWDTVTVDVSLPSTHKSFDVHIEASTDDAEEELAGPMTILGTRIELGEGAGEAQTVGFRFNWLGIPPGATILNAYIQFKVNQASADTASFTIKGQASDNAPTFGFTQFDITNRVTTTASLPWSPPAWNNVGDQGPDQRTPDLAVVVQEIIDRPGWVSGNSVAFIINGTGMRVAQAYDGDPCGAAVLHIEYDVPPVANAGGPYQATLGGPVQFDGTGSSDPDGTIASYDWDFGDGNTGTGSNPTHTYASEGNYTVKLTVTDDAGLTDVDQTTANTQNQAPVGNADTYEGLINEPLNVTQPEGVLKNDTDSDLDSLTAMKETDPSNGTLTLNGNGSFVYIPDSDFYGIDSFTYKVFDGLTYSNTTIVKISIIIPVFLPVILR